MGIFRVRRATLSEEGWRTAPDATEYSLLIICRISCWRCLKNSFYAGEGQSPLSMKQKILYFTGQISLTSLLDILFRNNDPLCDVSVMS